LSLCSLSNHSFSIALTFFAIRRRKHSLLIIMKK
jgi:hypothetical protein